MIPEDPAGPPPAETPPERLTVGPGTVVRLRYRATDAEGAPIPAEDDEVDVLFGYGLLLPALERALEGRRAGARVETTLTPDEAFGERDEAAVLDLERGELPADAREGDRFEVDGPEGARLVLQVLELDDEHAVVDLNHPLAGQEVTFRLDVVAVRAASRAELDAAERRLEGASSPAPPADSALIPASRLLSPGARRYESGPPAERRRPSPRRTRRRRP